MYLKKIEFAQLFAKYIIIYIIKV